VFAVDDAEEEEEKEEEEEGEGEEGEGEGGRRAMAGEPSWTVAMALLSPLLLPLTNSK